MKGSLGSGTARTLAVSSSFQRKAPGPGDFRSCQRRPRAWAKGFRVFRVRGLGVQVFLDLRQFRVRGLGLFWIRCEVYDEFSGFRAGGVGQDVALKPVDHTRIKHSGLF